MVNQYLTWQITSGQHRYRISKKANEIALPMFGSNSKRKQCLLYSLAQDPQIPTPLNNCQKDNAESNPQISFTLISRLEAIRMLLAEDQWLINSEDKNI